jgi:hypothetical protein
MLLKNNGNSATSTHGAKAHKTRTCSLKMFENNFPKGYFDVREGKYPGGGEK